MTRSTELVPKKESNCNVVATWLCHVILLIIISNNILLSPLIALTNYLIPDDSSFWYTKPHLSIVENRLFYIALLRSAPAAILFVGKHSLHHPIAVSFSTYQHPICLDVTFFDSISFRSGSLFIALQLQADDKVINLFPSQVIGLQCGKETTLIHTKR